MSWTDHSGVLTLDWGFSVSKNILKLNDTFIVFVPPTVGVLDLISVIFFSLGGDPSHDVCCPDVWSSSDWWKRGRHFPAQDQGSGGGPQGAAPWHVNPCRLQAQPNKPPYTNSGCTHLMNITVTAVDILLYWLFRKKEFWITVGSNGHM